MQRRTVIAPDSFKGTASAAEVAAAIRRGWLRARPGDECVEVPMADGGEGTTAAIAGSVPGARVASVRVEGPLGAPVDAELVELPDGTWVVELAETSGIALLDGVDRESCARASTIGLGQAIRFAAEHGARRVLVGLGSSASTDGGAGMLSALGVRFLDAAGADIPLGNRGLHSLESVDISGLVRLPADGLVALTDVVNPLFGVLGAAAVFGPQKGASVDDVPLLEAGLTRLAQVLDGAPEASGDVLALASHPGAGAAGGTGFGLLAVGAEVSAGAVAVAEAVGLRELLRGADLVITGEGSFDAQSEAGKVPSLVRKLAQEEGARFGVIAGRVGLGADERAVLARDGVSIVSLSELAGSGQRAMDETLDWVEVAGERMAGTVEF
ncbi:glycerate kinase [Pseudoclavibacter sp. RFBJ3]|uniref:glycerate kinase n=1 Tax=unclassified Pseudoclavibacter TaxID=2615177 RepID=UPI000CE7F378|nr:MULTISPECIES: glycerate kinase [unclassified Pseudoclavibacter]PPF80946.1 glycerate kinase [Pseudoclavibacter sp. RFBJ5]PPF94454.1 glycerate kinase [Pseudoclavibacter sp. RFBJ3]PPF99562.1 glycerate kinase [Pseudoclavibacter sp. RFBH5]PPG25756.1 glycerate kinase [Pseudoclavibacter sp. RFBI4]